MRLVRSLSVAALAVLCAPTFAGAAAPAGTRSVLEVFQVPTRTGAVSDVEFALSLARGSAPTAKVSFYVPAGYVANLASPVGTKLGTVVADFTAGTNVMTANGTVTADDPARHVTDTCAPGSHAAVWLLSVTVSGQPVTIPLYVDPATPDIAAQASYTLTACPDAPRGRQLSDLDVELTSSFRNPAGSGTFVWRAIVTPFTAAAPNAAAASELQALVALPHRVTLRARYDRRRHRVTLTGVASAGGSADSKVPVALYTTPDPGKTAPTRIGTARTDAHGAFTFTHALTKTTYVFAVVPELIFKPGDCEPTLGPSPCANETVSESEPALVKVRV